MRKWLLGIILIIFIFIASVYVFIPHIIRISSSATVTITQDGLYRSLLNNKDWSKWWPGKVVAETDSTLASKLEYNNCIYNATGSDYGNLLIAISGANFKAKSSIIIVPEKIDTLKLTWVTVIPSSYNPVKRLKIYFESQRLKTDISLILEKIQIHFSNPENVYSLKIQHELVKDSFLVSTYKKSNNYPSSNDIYNLIDKLKNYISLQSATESGYPMLNIIKEDSISWLIKVAIPTNKILESKEDISFKRMLGQGKILMCEIKGGPESVNNALRQMEYYVADYHYYSPAIPFQSLITNRTQEPDTSKWVTRVYFPVMFN